MMASAGLIALVGPALVEAGQWVVTAAEQTPLQPGVLIDGGKPLKLAEGHNWSCWPRMGKHAS